MSPEQACKKAIERILQCTPKDKKDMQVGFLALNKNGESGGYAIRKNFDFGTTSGKGEFVKTDSKFILE